MSAITLSRVTKSYDSRPPALNEVTLDIEEGSIYGMLGPNGAGKTTAIRVINGIIPPTSGDVRVLGMSVCDEVTRIHALTGMMTENAATYESMTGLENLLFFGAMHGMTSDRCGARIRWLLEYLRLDDARHQRVRTYSSGMKKKLSLAIALLHEPRLLYLDEPTAALDPEAAQDVMALVSDLNQREGLTVILCSHQLRYLEGVCTHYGFLSTGCLVANGTFEELCRRWEFGVRFFVRTDAPSLPEPFVKSGDGWTCPLSSDADAASLLAALVASGARLYEARQERPTLEDVYFHIHGGTA